MTSVANSEPSGQAQAGFLRDVIDTEGLALVYQPKFSVATGAACGVEVLARWPGPRSAKLWQQPDHFIRCAEQQGLAPKLDCHVLSKALGQISQWPAWLRLNLEPVSVNVSASSVGNEGFLRSAKRILSSTLHPRIMFELTETAPLDNTEQAVKAFKDLARYGVEVSLDDFGQGHNQPSRMELFQARELKIDKKDTAGIDSHAGRQHVQELIGLARKAGLSVTAEGVECREQWQLLQALGCDYAQGFWLSPPLPSAATVEFVQQHSPEILKPGVSSPLYDPRQLWSGLAMRQHYG